jgi:hypothetical protein
MDGISLGSSLRLWTIFWLVGPRLKHEHKGNSIDSAVWHWSLGGGGQIVGYMGGGEHSGGINPTGKVSLGWEGISDPMQGSHQDSNISIFCLGMLICLHDCMFIFIHACMQSLLYACINKFQIYIPQRIWSHIDAAQAFLIEVKSRDEKFRDTVLLNW